MHLDDEQIQRALDRELDTAANEAAARHVAECKECAARLEEATREESWLADRLGEVDDAPPAVDVRALMRRAREGEAAERRPRWTGRQHVRRAPSRQLRWAAGIVLALAAVGTAYAWPGSPVPDWVNRVVAWVTGTTPETPPEGPASPVDTAPGGIAVEPGERFTVRFAAPQTTGAATVTLTAGPRIVVRVANGAPTFTSDEGRLVVENGGSTANYEIELPRTSAWIAVEIGSRRAVLVQRGQVVTAAPVDARGRYVLSLRPPAR